jgi:hypothetical protein
MPSLVVVVVVVGEGVGAKACLTLFFLEEPMCVAVGRSGWAVGGKWESSCGLLSPRLHSESRSRSRCPCQHPQHSERAAI